MGLASGPGVFMLEGVYINNFFIAVTKFLRRSSLKEERYFGSWFKGIMSFRKSLAARVTQSYGGRSVEWLVHCIGR